MHATTIAHEHWIFGATPVTEPIPPSARRPVLRSIARAGAAGGSSDDAALDLAMECYACGDTRAFAVLHRALHPRLAAYLLRMTGSRALADDLLQETFLRVHRARATFASGGAVLPWAYAIARNAYLDHNRSTRRSAIDPLADEARIESAAVGAVAESSAIAAEAARIVEQVLARLPASQREAFILIRYEGLSVQDAAAVLGATPTAVKLRAFRAYEALRAALDETLP